MYLENPEINELLQATNELEIQSGESLFLMFGEKQVIDFHSLQSELTSLNIDFFGGIFPGIIYRNLQSNQGCILLKLKTLHPPILIQGLETPDFDLPDFPSLDSEETNKKTVLTLVDGLTSNIATFLSEIHNVLGNTVNFIGGGAGSLSLVQRPCVFTNQGLFQDAAIVCFLDYQSKMGVRHGWQQLEGPIVATRTDKNIIHELNWQNAFEVYSSVVNADSTTSIGTENFFDIAKGYPFGIFKEDSENIVRDPISVDENGALICVGEVPENTVLYILKGDREALIASARKAVEDTLTPTDDSSEIVDTLIVDCISRTLFLEEGFSEELKVVLDSVHQKHPNINPSGVLTLGEISSYGEGFLEFFNKTIVVGTFFK